MLKKLSCIILLLLAVISAAICGPAPLVVINNKIEKIENIDISTSNHIMVWVRDLEKIGWGTVSMDKDGSTIFSNSKVTLTFTKNSESAKLNSLSVKLPVKPYLKDGKLMVPMSFVAKSLDYNYVAEDRPVVIIKYDEKIPAKPATNVKKTEPTAAPAEPVKSEKKPDNNSANISKASENWFQGVVVYNGIKLSNVKIILKNSKDVAIKSTTTNSDGVFAFYGIGNDTYKIVINNSDNPKYRTQSRTNIIIKDAVAKKLDKPIYLLAAVNIKTIGLDKKVNAYNLKWDEVSGAASYKLTVVSNNKKAKQLVLVSKTNSVSVPQDKLSKGQTYTLNLSALSKSGHVIGESNGKAWNIKTP